MEEKILQRKKTKALASKESRDEIVGYRVHELKTPITVMLGYGSLLLSDEDLDKKEKTVLSRLKSKSTKIGKLARYYLNSHNKDLSDGAVQRRQVYFEGISNLLSEVRSVILSPEFKGLAQRKNSLAIDKIKESHNRAEYALRRVELNEHSTEKASILLDSFYAGASRDYRVKEGNVTVEKKFSQEDLDMPQLNISDMSFIYDVLFNNSLEAGAKKLNLEALLKDGHFELRMKDDGKGIPKDILYKIGQAGETYGKLGGTGFGVANVKKIVEDKYHGKFTIYSAGEGTGTQVTIKIPLYSEIKSKQKVIAN